VKPNINSVDVHPQFSTNGHPVDGALVGVGSLARNIPVLGGYGTCAQNWIGYQPVLLQKNGWSIIQGDT